MSKLLERIQVAAGFLPVDVSTGTASKRIGDWVSLAKYGRLAAVFFKDDGTAGEDPTITLEQATSASGDNAVGLNFSELYEKRAAAGGLFGVGQWTKVGKPASSTYTHEDAGESELIWAIEVEATDLLPGYSFVRLNCADVGVNAQLACVLYVLGDPRYELLPSEMFSPLS